MPWNAIKAKQQNIITHIRCDTVWVICHAMSVMPYSDVFLKWQQMNRIHAIECFKHTASYISYQLQSQWNWWKNYKEKYFENWLICIQNNQIGISRYKSGRKRFNAIFFLPVFGPRWKWISQSYSVLCVLAHLEMAYQLNMNMDMELEIKETMHYWRSNVFY